MNKATVTKVLNKISAWNGDESLAYIKWAVLPKKVQRAIQTKYLVETGRTDHIKHTKSTLGEMTLKEYAEWLRTNF